MFRLVVTMETEHLDAERRVREMRPAEKPRPNIQHINQFTIKVEQYFVV